MRGTPSDLDIRPIYHWLSGRVRAHVFLCMLAYYVEWHMRRKLAPMLFDDEDKEAALASRPSPVAKAPPSEKAKAKDAGKRTEDDQPVHSFHTLIADLGTLCLNEVAAAVNPSCVLTMTTRPTAIQQKALRGKIFVVNVGCRKLNPTPWEQSQASGVRTRAIDADLGRSRKVKSSEEGAFCILGFG